jgi:hypothetical protein
VEKTTKATTCMLLLHLLNAACPRATAATGLPVALFRGANVRHVWKTPDVCAPALARSAMASVLGHSRRSAARTAVSSSHTSKRPSPYTQEGYIRNWVQRT